MINQNVNWCKYWTCLLLYGLLQPIGFGSWPHLCHKVPK